MRKQCILALMGILLSNVDGSVIFPFHNSESPASNRRFGQDRECRRQRNTGTFWYPRRNTPNAVQLPTSSLLPNSSNMPLAFSSVQPGSWVLLATALGYVGNKLRSESVTRALYFWVHAGPIVVHYKFTRWFLDKTKAPLEKRDRVYNTLHDKYCQKSLDIALHLKGLYVKVGVLCYVYW
jgi:hypothetical protein